jgi:hypothetical protein
MPETANMELTSYLIMPIQRIPRYVLLLSDLFKNTPEDHKDYEDLKKALAKMESVAEYVNTKKREAENLMGVLIVSKHISDMVCMRNLKCEMSIAMTSHNCSPNAFILQDNPAELAQPHRRYVRQGLLSEVDGKNIKNRYAFLFNDSLLCTKEEKSMLARLAKNAPTGNIDLETLRTSEAMFKYQYQVPLVGARLGTFVLLLSRHFFGLFSLFSFMFWLQLSWSTLRCPTPSRLSFHKNLSNRPVYNMMVK